MVRIEIGVDAILAVSNRSLVTEIPIKNINPATSDCRGEGVQGGARKMGMFDVHSVNSR